MQKKCTHFLPRDIIPYMTPVPKMSPLPKMVLKLVQRTTAGKAILKVNYNGLEVIETQN